MEWSNLAVRLSGKAMPSFYDIIRYYKFFLPYVRKYRFPYACILVLVLLSVLTTLAYAWFLKGIMEAAVNHDVRRITLMIGFGVVFYLVSVSVNFFSVYLRTVTMNKLRRDVKADLFKHLTGTSRMFYNLHRSGDLMSRLNNDTEIAVGAVGTNLVHLFRLPVTAGAAFVYLFGMNEALSLTLLCFGPLALVSATIFSRYIRINGRQIQSQLGRITALVSEVLAGQTVVRAFALESFFQQKYEGEMDVLLHLQTHSARLGGGFRIGAQVAGAAALLFCIGMGAYDVSQGLMTAGALLAFISLMNHLVSPFTGMARQFGGVQRSMAAAERLWEVFENQTEETLDQRRNLEPAVYSHVLVLRSVSFSYGETQRAVDGVNLELSTGKVYAFVGPSGAGKSTLFQLIMRFYRPQDGEIFLNGLAYGKLTASDVRQQIAYVQQEPFLFSGSIRENILLGRASASDTDVIQAAKDAHIHEFIVSLPQGYETEVGEHGVCLSGGQKQRISIARAFLKNAPILLLDEATSALDSESETLVHTAIKTLMESRTTLVIAHRLSTVQHAHCVFVMNEGRIVETGTHENLMHEDGMYARLYTLQFGDTHLANRQTVRA